MAQPLIHQLSYMYMESAYDLGLETYVIVNEEELEKWYLRAYDEATNRVTWTQLLVKAKEFDTEKEAIAFGKTLQREFSVEQHDSWIF